MKKGEQTDAQKCKNEKWGTNGCTKSEKFGAQVSIQMQKIYAETSHKNNCVENTL